ncbi:transporter [Paenibacillus swuensis]|uniref:Transporter n=1 Tax=Paenibacillus swuensis TaxID=1178515 RepID=A0A172TF44_9BACL|nr:DMT family transporter [Paenibacillus swuensis]ANE45572.1 transporter [Paenibacillus swuensis]
MKDPHGLKFAYLLVVLNSIILGFSFLFSKIALEHAHPLDTLTFRFAASFAGLSVPVALGFVKLNYRGKPLGKALMLSSMYPLGFFTLQAYGLQYTSSAEGGIIYAFTPIVTMIVASLFLKEATSLLQKTSIFLSVFGVVFIFMMKGSQLDLSNRTGIILLFMTCVASAGYTVMARSLSKTFSPLEMSYFMLGVGFAVFLVISVAKHAGQGTLETFFTPLTIPSFVWAIVFLGLLASLGSALTFTYVLSKIEASQMSVFANLSTIVSIAAGAIFLGEEVTWYHLLGSMMIVTGVIGTQYLGKVNLVQPKVKAEQKHVKG